MELIKLIGDFIFRLFCSHDYCLDDPDEVFPSPPEGGSISFIRWHTCSKCGKRKLIGSGMIY